MIRDQELAKVLEAVEHYDTFTEAAEALGIPRKTFTYRLQQARERLKTVGKNPKSEISLPDFPSHDIPTEELIDTMVRRFEARKASYKAHTWFPVKIKNNLPIGVMWMGDPHVDDSGCDWTLLRRHCELCKNTPGLYGVNIGDVTNNWSGRLAHLYSEQDTSKKTARELAAWFMLDSGVEWLVWLLGNHDQWGDGSAVLQEMGRRFGTSPIVCHDWEARFRLEFPNGKSFRIWTAHDFKGHSMWNPLHGALKAGKYGTAEVLVCGHKHNWGYYCYEIPEHDINQTIIRTRGYKFMDSYARNLGITEQERGAAILSVFDPSEPDRKDGVITFDNVERGVEFLTMLREKAKGESQ